MSDPEGARYLLDLPNGRWTRPVLAGLDECGRRYQDLHDALGGISHAVLTETLRRAERDGLIARRPEGVRIETGTLYEITDLGRSLNVLLAVMEEWASRNWRAVEVSRQRWDRMQ